MRQKGIYSVFTGSQRGGQHPQAALWILQLGKLRHGAAHNSFTVSTPERSLRREKFLDRLATEFSQPPSLPAMPLFLPESMGSGGKDGGTSPSLRGTPGQGVGSPHTRTRTQAHSRTHTKLRVISAGTRRSPRWPLLRLRMHSASLQGGPPWAPGWGCSERGLCPSLPLFQAALSLFPPFTPSNLTPSSHSSPSTPSPPSTQRRRSCYWGSLERGGHPQPGAPAKTSRGKARAPIAGSQRSS